MDDILLLAQDQGVTQVDTHPDHLLLLIISSHEIHQRCQQFHFNKHVPAKTVFVLDIPDIVTVDHIGMAFQFQHHGILPDNLLQIALEVGGDACIIIAFAAQVPDLLRALGNTDDFQGSAFQPTIKIPANFVYRTETSLTQNLDNVPTGPKLIDLIHVILSLPV